MNSFEEGKKAAELNQPRKVPNKYQGDKVHKLRWLSGFDSIKIKEQQMNSFQNGVAKAEQEIMNKANKVGVKLKNANITTKKVLDKWLSENKKRKIIHQELKANGTIVTVEDEMGGRSDHSISWK